MGARLFSAGELLGSPSRFFRKALPTCRYAGLVLKAGTALRRSSFIVRNHLSVTSHKKDSLLNKR